MGILNFFKDVWFTAHHIYLTAQQGWDPMTIHDDNCGCKEKS